MTAGRGFGDLSVMTGIIDISLMDGRVDIMSSVRRWYPVHGEKNFSLGILTTGYLSFITRSRGP